MPRFAILRHEAPDPAQSHYDIFLSQSEDPAARLFSLKVAELPLKPASLIAERQFDHRPLYLDYEGPLSEGRGEVTRWDGGAHCGLADGERPVFEVELAGQRWRGRLRCVRLAGEPERWALTLTPEHSQISP